ncbi:AarF/ABC1/UbiB kinase family protein [Paenibacillus psychroresistens]|uniref:AarF/ABC1/UbiB kinase family protein n=1 Tax=Paenibacillus psychroresistens TaxID=1778678 RepID=A0A6B8RQN2_9BACL|nr:AarF/UbiB family protein [Paenibacillus psychroresistens]QGQ98701.1 AarF/ABC1/UbiB kinase family protein [Paenibacillus psychroresistens]
MKTNRLYRIWVITTMSIRFFLEIWWFQQRKAKLPPRELTLQWELLLKQQAKRFKARALSLEGILIKVGQFLSTRADLLPAIFTDELSGLIDQVTPVPREAALKVLESQWQAPYTEHLLEIGTAAVASASIAVVYKAKLLDGTAVAIKIQRPRIDRIFQADFRAIRIVMKLTKRFTSWGKSLDLDRLYSELVEIVSKELDFIQEMQHAESFERNIDPALRVRVPKYYTALITRRIIVMEWIEGFLITDLQALHKHGLKPKEIVQRFAASFLQQLIVDGFFHADPHPGNIRLEADGTLVFIDFGMMGSISRAQRTSFISLISALLLQNYPLMVTALAELRFVNKVADQAQIADAMEAATNLYLSRGFQSFDEQAIQTLMTQLRSFVNGNAIQMPAEFAFLGRAAGIVSGVIATLAPDVDYLALGKEIAKPMLDKTFGNERKDVRYSIPPILLLTGKAILRLPLQLEQLLQIQIRQGELSLKQSRANGWTKYYQKKQKFTALLFVSLWLAAIGLYAFQSHEAGYAAAVSSLPFLVYYRSLDKKFERMMASPLTEQAGDLA